MTKKITLLSYNLSDNSFGRVYLLAKVLSRRYKIEIVGPCFGNGIWPPCANLAGFEVKTIKGQYYPYFIKTTKNILKMITGDIIYAIKIRPSSFGIGIIKHQLSKLPLILDIDDWEVGFHLQKKGLQLIETSLKIFNPNGLLYCMLLEKLLGFADGITTVSPFLREKFGGFVIPHSKDTNALDPAKYDYNLSRKKIGAEKFKVIMFLGTPRAYKGLEDVIYAIQDLKRNDIIFMIIGGDINSTYEKHLLDIGREKVRIFGFVPFDDIPFYLSAADIVVIPQRDTPATKAQLPAKVFDAMSMGKPVIATKVSMLPEILDGCGLIIDPGKIPQLAESINYILTNPAEANKMGLKARERCIEKYSWDRMEVDLCRIFDRLL